MTLESFTMPNETSTDTQMDRLARAALLVRTAIRLLEPLGHESPELWEANMSLLNAVANLRLARGER